MQEAGQVRQALDGIAAEVAATAPAGLFQQPADGGGVLAAQLTSLHQVGRSRVHIFLFDIYFCVCRPFATRVHRAHVGRAAGGMRTSAEPEPQQVFMLRPPRMVPGEVEAAGR